MSQIGVNGKEETMKLPLNKGDSHRYRRNGQTVNDIVQNPKQTSSIGRGARMKFFDILIKLFVLNFSFHSNNCTCNFSTKIMTSIL